jgi:peptidoglycan/xylan/chitin deacetylase (PgdA/CDA1 family)
MKKTLVRMGYYSGLLKAWLKPRRGGFFPILMYHHVTEREEPFFPHVTRKVFARQMDFVRKHYRVWELGRLAEMLKTGEPIPARALALTFDDEYEDVYRNAFPLLQEHSIPATIFITTGCVDTDRIPWTDELGFLFQETGRTGFQLDRAEGREVFSWSDGSSRLAELRRAKALLKNVFEEERTELFERIRRQLAVTKKSPSRILNRSEIREMAEAEIDFGAHTVNHPILTRVPPRTAREEIAGSKRDLEEILGREVTGFCYPNGQPGDFDGVIEGMVRHVGFRYACSTIEGVNDAATDPYALKRTWTSEPSLSLFAARLLRSRRTAPVAPPPSSTG